MGNYIQRCKKSSPQKENTREIKEKSSGDNMNMRVKILLTKNELERLMSQLRNSEGKRLEDVLGEIQRSRRDSKAAAAVNWRPPLDVIDESPHEVCEDR